jgi:hypothetical protein
MTEPVTRWHLRPLLAGACSLLVSTTLWAGPPDPFAGNNTVYPDAKDWSGGFRTSNYDYPPVAPPARWLQVRPKGRITLQSAPAYVAAMKKFIAPEMAGLVNDPMNWTPQKAGWYDMPWGGQGSPMSNGKINAESGREPLLGSYTGQILQPDSYPSNPPQVPFQNHAVVYYNDVAGYQLGKIWKDPFHPDLKETQFPEGAIVVKVEGATLTEDQWPVLKNSSVSTIYRPTTATMAKNPGDPTTWTPEITPMRFLQMAVRVKDREASPVTGWVFMAFAYDTRSGGATPWDRALPVGAMWGNDPKLAKYPDGLGPKGKLEETWVAPNLPSFITDGLGWGGRLAGPLDLGIRHNVVTVSGKRYGDGSAKDAPSLGASSCMSCHSTGQYPFVANLYPSPNMVFPPEGGQFLMYDPGTPLWGQWFQNLPGNRALSAKGRKGIVATDYDMMLTFALMAANGAAGTDAFIRHRFAGH